LNLRSHRLLFACDPPSTTQLLDVAVSPVPVKSPLASWFVRLHEPRVIIHSKHRIQ
jgi:hypothetical protein